MRKKEKDLNDKLKLDRIDWVEVIEALDPKVGFRESDIKRALKKTGRSFNNNGPFHTTVRNFVKFLGKDVKIEMVGGEKVYTILNIPAKKVKAKTTDDIKPVVFPGPREEIEVKKEITDEEKIKDIFKKTYNGLSWTIKLLAVFIKYESKTVSGESMRKEFEALGMKYKYYLTYGRPMTKKILKRLGLPEITIKRYGSKGGSDWIFDCNEILDTFIRLQEIYKNLSGTEHENLDDYISTKKAVAQPKKEEKKDLWEKVKEIQKPKEISIINRKETDNTRWTKWLLLEALRDRRGATTSVESLVRWIKTDRYAEIDKNEAVRLFREMKSDSGDIIEFSPGDRVSYSDKSIKVLFERYDPKKIVETVYIKVRMTPEEMRNTFPDLVFSIDEALDAGKYIYKIVLDRSYKMEIYLKKLLRIVQISGTIYNPESYIISRVSKIIENEDSKNRMTNNNILILESI